MLMDKLLGRSADMAMPSVKIDYIHGSILARRYFLSLVQLAKMSIDSVPTQVQSLWSTLVPVTMVLVTIQGRATGARRHLNPIDSVHYSIDGNLENRIHRDGAVVALAATKGRIFAGWPTNLLRDSFGYTHHEADQPTSIKVPSSLSPVKPIMAC